MQISVGSWLIIDAALDNAIAVALQSDGDDAMVAHARALRERGWAAGEAHAQHDEGPVGWPPRSASLDIEATAADLDFLRAQVDAAIEVTEGLLDDDRLHPQARAEQERSRTLAERTREELAAVAGS
ncbi:membrane-bound lytic murein transglycosylase B [Agrococcus sp. UYP10]|uniref:hypothetical protein n=1 Tax=Agrococcus sp. UYP10 TaxID=1756355 RepID=UPI00339B30AE